jgi:ATP-dependent protease ClpP protease subunit
MFQRFEDGSLTGLLGRLVNSVERFVDNNKAVDPSPPSTASERQSGGDYVPMTVEQSGANHIYFYAKVNTDRCLDLIKKIRDIDGTLRNERIDRMLPDDYPQIPIWLHIQSGGGELFTGLNVADQIATIQTPIYSIVEGVCASAATLLSMACAKRFITRSSFMLVHQLSSWGYGTYEQLQDDLHVMDMMMERLYDFYGSKSSLSKENIKAILRRDSWFNAEECLENGMVDEILI